MKRLFFAIFTVALAQSLFAVNPVPYTLGLGFSFRISGVGSGMMTVYGDAGSPLVSHTTYSATTESPISMAWLKPGKEYQVNFQSSGPYEFWLSFIVPQGYQLFINDVPTDLYYFSTGGGAYNQYHYLVLRPIVESARRNAGTFSGINLGKSVSWNLGLGSFRSGHTAGLVHFGEMDLTVGTTSPASRDRLSYEPPPNASQCRVVRDGSLGLTVKQIGVPQTVVDFVDDGGGSGYTAKFYAVSDATWTGTIYTFINSPWRTVHVESPATNELKITETEDSISRVSHLSLTSGSVASGTYVWTLQEGNASTWLRTTTHTSTNNGDGTRDDVVVVRTDGTGGVIVDKTKYRYSCPTALSTGAWNTITYNTTTCPLTVAPGASVSFNCNVTNTGTNTWGSNHYLVLRDSSYGNLSFASTSGLAPAANTTVGLSFTAPATPGTYTYYLQGLENGVFWFATTATLTVTVRNSGSSGSTDTAAYNTTTFPLAMMPGTSVNFSSNITNTGTNTWGSNHYLWLRDGGYSNLAIVSTSGIAPAGSTSVSLPVTAPTTPGTYTYYLHAVNNGVTWFPTLAPLSLTVINNGWGEEVTQIIKDPDTAALTTTFEYYTNPANAGNYSRLKSVTDSTGNWTAYLYYDDWDRRGQLAQEFHPYTDLPAAAASASASTGRSIFFDYAAGWTGRHTRLVYREEKTKNVVSGFQTWAYDNSSSSGWARDKFDMKSYRDASNYHQDRVETIQSGSPEEGGEPVLMRGANLVQTTWNRMPGNYVSGTFTYSSSGVNWRELVIHGTTSSSGATSESSYNSQSFDATYVIPNQSTMEVTIRDAAGNVIRTETQVYEGSATWTPLNYVDFTYDSAGRLTQSLGSNGATNTTAYTFGLVTSTKDFAGNETYFTYDAVGRVATSVKVCPSSGYSVPTANITTTYTYDGANHVVKTEVTASGAPDQTATAEYYLTGQLKKQIANFTAADPTKRFETGYAYASGGKVVTATLPGGATRITEVYLDGQVKSVSGTAVVAENYSYDVDTGTGKRLCQSVIGGNYSAWTNTYVDWLGRKVEEWKPQWDGNNYARTWYYNSSNQLYKFGQPGLADTLFVYDTLGVKTMEGLDINGNGALDFASSDRISQQVQGNYTWDGGTTWYHRTDNYTYATANSGTPTYLGYTLVRLNNPSGYLDVRYIVDIYGNYVYHTTSFNRTNKVLAEDTYHSDSSVWAQKITYNGLVVSTKDTTNLTRTFGYDALGRPTTSVDPRTGTTTTAYVSGTSQVWKVTDPASVAQATYTYDTAGRVDTVTNGLGKISRYSYTNRNEQYRVWGETDYPVEYAYNGSGQMTTMKTYRGGSNWNDPDWANITTGTADTTTWSYNAATSLLASKTDAASKSVDYTYTVAQQVATRLWARILSGSTRVTTTYSYSSTTGELTGVAYNDGQTQNLSYTYNRLGQSSTVVDYAGTRTFTYNLAGTLELSHEDFPAFYNSRRLTYGYDTTGSGTIGRPISLGLGTSSNATADQTVDYGYDGYGRLNSVSGNATGHTNYTYAYTYTSNSNLVGSVANSTLGYTDARTYDSNHNWVDSRTTTKSSVTKADFAYTQDNLGRITQVAKTSGATELYGRYGNGTDGLTTYYGYDDRSQLTSEVTKLDTGSTVLTGRDDSHAYDTIGNRSTVTHNSNSATYTTNSLNQYSSRTVPGFFDVAGAAAGATVTVNSSSTGVIRHGPYFFKAQALSNNPSPVASALTIADGTTTTNLTAFLAGTPEGMNYDWDGNLIEDGRWTYLYDGENRLLWMETAPAAISGLIPKQGIYYAYDYLGRRIWKYNYDWVSGAWAYHSAERYIYNGWNLIAILDNATNLSKSCFWGLDLSGSMQGAGGVGGLLMTQEGGNSYLPIYDGNGNVHGMITAGSVTLDGTAYAAGDIVAGYEYDAFGNTLRESGKYAAANPFRYSTKFTDVETGLLYYGMRYYSPSMGRFINKDPIGERGGLNLYAFCANNGVNAYDVLGQDAFMTWNIQGAPGNYWSDEDNRESGFDRETQSARSPGLDWGSLAEQALAAALVQVDRTALGIAVGAAKQSGERSTRQTNAVRWVATGVLAGNSYLFQALDRGHDAMVADFGARAEEILLGSGAPVDSFPYANTTDADCGISGIRNIEAILSLNQTARSRSTIIGLLNEPLGKFDDGGAGMNRYGPNMNAALNPIGYQATPRPVTSSADFVRLVAEGKILAVATGKVVPDHFVVMVPSGPRFTNVRVYNWGPTTPSGHAATPSMSAEEASRLPTQRPGGASGWIWTITPLPPPPAPPDPHKN